jgi:predicted enzyme related to lactoylglutathione lyase
MIIGTHALIYTRNAKRLRAFFRNTLRLKSVDAGDGWLIFALPPAELGVHPTSGRHYHELYLMCDDLDATMTQLKGRGVKVAQPVSAGYGRMTSIALPGGGTLGLYEPRHRMAIATGKNTRRG